MAKSTARGSLSSLTARLAPKAVSAPAIEDEDAETPDAAVAAARSRDYKTMMCRVNRAGWQEMSRLAIDLERNLEDMMIEACNDYLRKNGKPPVIEKRSVPR